MRLHRIPRDLYEQMIGSDGLMFSTQWLTQLSSTRQYLASTYRCDTNLLASLSTQVSLANSEVTYPARLAVAPPALTAAIPSHDLASTYGAEKSLSESSLTKNWTDFTAAADAAA